MPPKQKMGSITHNSAEVNRGSSKGGMLSKLKGSFTTSSKASTSKSVKKNSGGPKSVNTNGNSTTHSGTAASANTRKLRHRAPNSFTYGDTSGGISREDLDVQRSFNTSKEGGIPSSIIALVDAASCITDDNATQQPPLKHAYQQPMPIEAAPPPSHNLRGSGVQYGGTSGSASRALANLHVSGGGGGGSPHDMHGHPSNGGYSNNYSYGSYNDSEQVEYYDNTGGGIFDESYMQSSRISVSAYQPPPPEKGYNRRSSNAEDYVPARGGYSHSRRTTNSSEETYHSRRTSNAEEGYNSRRTSNAEEFMVQGGTSYYRGSSYDSTPLPQEFSNGHVNYRGSSDGDVYPGAERYATHPPHPPKRISIDSAGCSGSGPNRKASVEMDPRKGGKEQHHSMGHGSTSSGHHNNVVNNTGRPSASDAGSRTRSPKPHKSSVRMSATSVNNPSWLNENSESPSRNDLQRSTTSRYEDDDDRTMATMATKAQALRPSAMNKAKDMTSPQGEVTIVYTDVQGSTSLWETCPSDMKKATDLHDSIIRKCYADHGGYEITTEGDSFNLAFQHPVDALAFALQAQIKLFKADWPEGILKHRDGKDEPALKFRGFRVRFGIHHGPTNSRVHEMTGRIIYSGEGVKISKAIESMCHGGQILTTMETWKAVSGMAERYLGRPQILDCGEHLLFETKNPNSSGDGYTITRYTRRIMQLVPSDLAFDFFEARGRRDVPSEDGKMGFEIKDASSVNGRLFPPLTSKRQLTTCFLNAPYAKGRVTICFVYTVGLDDNPNNRAQNLAVLAKYLRKRLLLLNPPGYECQEDNGTWMLAFDRMAHAVTFGLQLKTALQGADDLVGSVDRDNMFKVGILSGPFTSMGPHKTTGMADYFGPIVNRAARVASNCEPGQVCVGIPLSNGVTADPPDFGPTVNVMLEGIKKLKGITIDVAIFACSKRRIESLY